MTLKEARIQKAKLMKELDDLWRKRNAVALVAIDPSENFNDYISVSADEVTDMIDNKMEEIFTINSFIHAANGIDFANREQDVVKTAGRECINDLLAKCILYRKEAEKCNYLGMRNKRERNADYRGGESLVTVATYDIKEYAERSRRFELQAENMSSKVDALDNTLICE